jgi:hypothetical protein
MLWPLRWQASSYRGSGISSNDNVELKADSQRQQQGIKTVLERIRFHQGFLLQVAPD